MPLSPLRETVWVTGRAERRCPETFTGLGVAVRPGRRTRSQHRDGNGQGGIGRTGRGNDEIARVESGRELDCALMPTPMEEGVVVEVAAYETKDGADATVNVRFVPLESRLALIEMFAVPIVARLVNKR